MCTPFFAYKEIVENRGMTIILMKAFNKQMNVSNVADHFIKKKHLITNIEKN